MTATYTFDVFSSLDGYGAHRSPSAPAGLASVAAITSVALIQLTSPPWGCDARPVQTVWMTSHEPWRLR